jgi:tryptophan-rich sensory protein
MGGMSSELETRYKGAGGDRRSRRQELLALAAFLLLCLGVSALGGLATSTSVGTWYQTLTKPAFNPPDWVFAPVWTTLFVMMAIAGWRVWRTPPISIRSSALWAFGVQLVLNLAWSALFFWMRSIGLALIEISVFWVSLVGTTILFWRVDRIAGALFLPYVAWVSFAVVLNAALRHLN